jgi:cell division protein FtsI/penicillin-binding protein 2
VIALGAFAVTLLAIAAAVVVGLGLVGGSDDTPAKHLDAFAAAWTKGDDAAASRETDAPAAALAALRANRAGLDGARVRVEGLGVTDGGSNGGSTGRARVTWQVPRIGPWSYTVRVRFRKLAGRGWRVAWAPTVVHPELRAGTRLGTTRTAQRRGRILDRGGAPLVASRPVVRVGVVAGKVTDPTATAAAFAQLLQIDAKPFARAIRTGGKQQFVSAITLRPEDYANVADQLTAIPGLQTVQDTAQLAPTKPFARQLLGGVGELSAEQLKRLGSGYAVGDVGGQWGLEAAFEARLAGTPNRAVVIRNARGAPIAQLLRRPGTRSQDLKTLLDFRAQSAAEDALADVAEKAKVGLVVVRPSSGDVLAVANRPVADTFDRALAGQYPPGSTFKVVSTDALLQAGAVTPDTTVGCPNTVNVGGRAYKNFEGEGGTTEPFSTAFAESCNTAFVPLAKKLAPAALTQAGTRFGLGAKLDLPVAAYGGQVPQPTDLVARASAMIGQDRILASPLAMAGVAATVANGRWHSPRLVPDDPRKPGDPLPSGVVDQLRSLTREVVTSGTGTALAGTSGDVHGKSGTAEYGSGNPLPTHAWFIAYRDDVAVAAIVEGGHAGGEVAAPLVARFFSALDAGVTATSGTTDTATTGATDTGATDTTGTTG